MPLLPTAQPRGESRPPNFKLVRTGGRHCAVFNHRARPPHSNTLTVMFRAVTAVLIGVGSFSASAKCIEVPYQVSGQIKNVMGRPVAEANVSVTWSDHVGGGVKQAVSSADGVYVAAFRSSTLSGDNLSHGDICEARVTSVTVEVAAKGYQTARSVVKFEGGAAQANYTLEPKR